jgi:hypothetical protein
VIEREQARLRMRRTAVTIIVLWWRRKRSIPLSRRLARLDKHVLRREFLEHKLETLQEVEDLQGMSVKLHKVSSHIKHIELKLEDIAKHLWSKDEVLSMEKVPTCRLASPLRRSPVSTQRLPVAPHVMTRDLLCLIVCLIVKCKMLRVQIRWSG